jgi:hypothetical protein
VAQMLDELRREIYQRAKDRNGGEHIHGADDA